jgi:hypothetical protein
MSSSPPPRYLYFLPLACLVPTAALFLHLSYFYGISDTISGWSAVSWSAPASSGTAASKFNFDDQAPVLRVTLAWFALYYSFLFFQSWTKLYAFFGLKDQSGDKNKNVSYSEVKYKGAPNTKYDSVTLSMDRSVGNMVEQFPFLVALWLHGTMVSAGSAGCLGWLWLWFRAIYPFAFARGLPILLVSTVPGYLFILAMCVPLARAVM